MEMFLFPKKNGNWEIWLLREAYIFEGKKQMKSVGSTVGWAGFLLHTQARHLLHFGCVFRWQRKLDRPTLIQGVSTHFDTLWRLLRPFKHNFYMIMKVSVYLWGLDVWFLSNSFQKSNIGWPQQPPTEKLLKFNMIFHDSDIFFSKHQNPIFYWRTVFFLWRLLRPADVTFLKTGWWKLFLVGLRGLQSVSKWVETPCSWHLESGKTKLYKIG